MILSLEWLSEFTDISGMGPKEFCDRMTDTGSKVENYRVLGENIINVKVGKILSVEKHENSDRLQICMTDAGGEKPLQIVTAATNVFPGAVVPVAVADARLPGGEIKKSKLRGVLSEGMFCSIAELELTTHDMPGAAEDGILILGEEFGKFVGADIRDVLKLSDTAVEFEITPNRPDCLSVIGLAREASVSFGRPLKLHNPLVRGSSDGDRIENYLTVTDSAPGLCPRYTARVVKDVKIAPSPLWMRARLRASGVRPINNIVDITNYVMLEYGQPMHAFDYKCLSGSAINVRSAEEGETFVSLDSISHTLDSSMLVIADAQKAVALAGVMGGENSEITDDTATVVFESATFHPGNVRVSAKKLGMRTESSSRFEKGLDSENTMPALNRACELVELLGAGEVVNGTIDVYPRKKETVTLPLDAGVINSFLGLDLTQSEMAGIMRKLEFGVSEDEKAITVPSFRDDVRCMNDVAEEVLRMYGYDKITSTLSGSSSPTIGTRTERQNFDLNVRSMLEGMGINEVQTFSFISPSWYDKIRLAADDERRKSVVISNPLGEDTSVMRTTMIPSMLKVLSDNFSMKNTSVFVFDLAKVYIPKNRDELPDEPARLAVGFIGKDGFYRMKGYIEALLKIAGIESAAFRSLTDEPTFHPGRCAEITVSGKRLGLFGEIHPEVAETYGISPAAYVAEIDEDLLFEERRKVVEYRQIPKHPAVERDFSFVCDEDVEAASIAKVIKSSSKLVESVELFDVYRGPQIGEHKKSMSYSVMLRGKDHTLNDEEANGAVKSILANLEKELNIKLR